MDKRGAREFVIELGALGGTAEEGGRPAGRVEFHVSKAARDRFGLAGVPYATAGGVTFADYHEARAFAAAINDHAAANGGPVVKAGAINAMGLLDEILHAVCALYRERVDAAAFDTALASAGAAIGASRVRSSLVAFSRAFPTGDVYAGRLEPEAWLDGLDDGRGKRAVALEELLLLRLANENPALEPYRFLFDDAALRSRAPVDASLDAAEAALAAMPPFGPDSLSLPDLLRAPMRASPRSLAGQLEYVRRRWGLLLGDRLSRLLGAADMLAEDDRQGFAPGPGPIRVPSYAALDAEYERFSEDKDWMPRVVMMAKSTLVWLDQLSKAYGRAIRTLDAIPDEELDLLAARGFNALWLIGLWERSQASRRIKELCGNPEAAPSAYSLFDYEIAWELGGWDALGSLRERALARGIRLAADMVPNHTGLDSAWVRDRPDLFVRRPNPPFPSYSYTGENLSGDGAIGVWLEDHYYDRRDAAVTFKRVDFRSGETSYVYHGNDGTSMPWNDTAQIDFLNPAAREAVRERILHVARNFPIIRFDAAMVLAKRSL
ncbi:MAG TPA: alpha-amylase family glycosyl hydrolase, partial [Spirochaetales bacterium]|nr:alpha-amylase family glycosyl hydrolase [Spirochaetales bacterium]